MTRLESSPRFLCNAAVKPRSEARYRVALRLFVGYLAALALRPTTAGQIDSALCDYFHKIYVSKGGKQKGLAENTYAALVHFNPTLKRRLPYSVRALKGWSKLKPSKSWTPLTHKIALLLAWVLFRSLDRFDMAVGALLSFEGYLRISEMVGIRAENVVMPGDDRRGNVIEHAQILIKDTKTKAFAWVTIKDDVVLFLLALQLKISKRHNSGRLFNFSQNQYRAKFREAAEMMGLPRSVVPHSNRHGKATHEYVNGTSVERIVVDGRWKSLDSARTYLQQAAAQLLSLSLTPSLQNLATLVSADPLYAFFEFAWHSST